MKKATVTYTAPKGDSKVVEMLGHTFYDGQGTDVVCSEDQMQRLGQNPHFKVGTVSDYEPPKEKEASEGDAPKEHNKTEKTEAHGGAHGRQAR